MLTMTSSFMTRSVIACSISTAAAIKILLTTCAKRMVMSMAVGAGTTEADAMDKAAVVMPVLPE